MPTVTYKSVELGVSLGLGCCGWHSSLKGYRQICFHTYHDNILTLFIMQQASQSAKKPINNLPIKPRKRDRRLGGFFGEVGANAKDRPKQKAKAKEKGQGQGKRPRQKAKAKGHGIRPPVI